MTNPTRTIPAPRGDTRGQRGVALFIVMVAIMIAAALSISLLMVANGHQKAVKFNVMKEQCFAIAEAGLDRAIAEANKTANKNDPNWPPPSMAIATAPNNVVRDTSGNQIGFFVVRITDGLADGIDNNGNNPPGGNLVDNILLDPEEGKYARVISTGFYGRNLGNYSEPGSGAPARDHYEHEVALECQIFNKNITPQVQGAVLIDDTPDISQSGTQWHIDGRDHDMNSLAVNLAAPQLPGLATTANDWGPDAITVGNKVAPPPPQSPQILGSPAAATAPTITDNVNIDEIMEWAANNVPDSNQFVSTLAAGNVNVPTTKGPFGTDPTPLTPGVFDVTYYKSNGAALCLGGAATPKGAGILFVDGPLTLNGAFAFTGIIIVKGTLSVNGAGGQTLCGAIIASGSPVINLNVSGNTDLLYSSAAVMAAQNMAVAYVLRSWREIKVPD